MSAHPYIKYDQSLDTYIHKKKDLQRKGVSFYVGYDGHGDVLATDCKRGLWYFTTSSQGQYFYGPYRSAQAARRGFDQLYKKLREAV